MGRHDDGSTRGQAIKKTASLVCLCVRFLLNWAGKTWQREWWRDALCENECEQCAASPLKDRWAVSQSRTKIKTLSGARGKTSGDRNFGYRLCLICFHTRHYKLCRSSVWVRVCEDTCFQRRGLLMRMVHRCPSTQPCWGSVSVCGQPHAVWITVQGSILQQWPCT